MPRDMTGCGRYPPQPRHKPLEFYSAVRLGDAAALEAVLRADPYFVTQDNGAGAPVHFAATYKQLDMVRDSGGLENEAEEITGERDRGRERGGGRPKGRRGRASERKKQQQRRFFFSSPPPALRLFPCLSLLFCFRALKGALLHRRKQKKTPKKTSEKA